MRVSWRPSIHLCKQRSSKSGVRSMPKRSARWQGRAAGAGRADIYMVYNSKGLQLASKTSSVRIECVTKSMSVPSIFNSVVAVRTNRAVCFRCRSQASSGYLISSFEAKEAWKEFRRLRDFPCQGNRRIRLLRFAIAPYTRNVRDVHHA